MLDCYLVPKEVLNVAIEDGAFTDSPPDIYHSLSITPEQYTVLKKVFDECGVVYEKFDGRGLAYSDDSLILPAEAKELISCLRRHDLSSFSSAEISFLNHFQTILDRSVLNDLLLIGIAD